MKESQPKNEDVMQLSPWEFDQSQNGWRKLAAAKKYIDAAALIRNYIAKNKERILNPQAGEDPIGIELMHFHRGQMLATVGQENWPEAIESFKQAFQQDSECWNAYVSATIGFLTGDKDRIEQAIHTIESSQEEKVSGNLGVVKNFKKALEAGVQDYDTPYSWPREEIGH